MAVITNQRDESRIDVRFLLRRLARFWEWIGLAAVLALAGGLDLWRLQQEGFANSYYAATVRSMLTGWHNFFYASFDPGGFVSVDKPPLGFWIQAASAKLFGFSGTSLLLPEAVAGVLSVAVLFFLVRRSFGAPAGLLAALALAVSPISVATNRNNTIDSLLALTVLLAAFAALKASEQGRLRWLLLCAVLVGAGFNIKMLEAYLVVLAFGLLYLVGAPLRWRTRIWHLGLAACVLAAVSLVWLVAVDLTPIAQRPYVGSTQHNSEVELAFGYNGLQRVRGGQRPFNRAVSLDRPASAGGRGAGQGQVRGNGEARGNGQPRTPAGAAPAARFAGGANEAGTPGVLRFFNRQLAGQAAWLLPMALLGLAAAVLTCVARRTTAWRQLLQRGRLDSEQQAVLLWGGWVLTEIVFFSAVRSFHSYYLTVMMPAVAALTGIGVIALWRAYRRQGWLGWLLPVALCVTAAVQVQILRPYPAWSHWLSPLIVMLCIIAAGVLLGARLLPKVSLPRALLVVAASVGVLALLIAPAVWSLETVRDANAASTFPTAGPPATAAGRTGPFDGAARGGNARSEVNAGLLSFLEANRGNARYLAATPSAQLTAPLILATGQPVMALGGFSGGDPILTEQQLANEVAAGEVRYFLLSGAGGFGGRGGAATGWVTENCALVPPGQWAAPAGAQRATTNAGQQLYDCAGATGGS